MDRFCQSETDAELGSGALRLRPRNSGIEGECSFTSPITPHRSVFAAWLGAKLKGPSRWPQLPSKPLALQVALGVVVANFIADADVPESYFAHLLTPFTLDRYARVGMPRRSQADVPPL